MNKLIKDINDGELFKFASDRMCTVRDGLIESLDDGWAARKEWHANKEVEIIELPKTPLEWVEFVRRVQIREEL